MEEVRPDERTRLFSRKESLADFAKYDHMGLSKILEVGRRQSSMLPMSVQPAVNALIMFVEMNSLVRLALYAAFVICLVAFGLFLLIVWGKCLGDTDNTAVFLFMVTTVLGEFGLLSSYYHSYLTLRQHRRRSAGGVQRRDMSIHQCRHDAISVFN